MRDAFYYGAKPNAHPREQHATSLEDARSRTTTEKFWIINEFCIYTEFDWNFEITSAYEVWAEDHTNIWPSIYQKDSGTWLCSINKDSYLVYRTAATPLKRKDGEQQPWVVHRAIENFDFNWHPDPTSPPYNYAWDVRWENGIVCPAIEYKVTGATQFAFMSSEKITGPFDIFYISRRDQGTRLQALKDRFGDRVKSTRFVGTWADTIVRCATKSTTKLFWIADSQLDYTNFTFEHLPEEWAVSTVHVFGTDDSKWGNTYLINKDTIADDTKYIKRIDHLPNLNFVNDKRAKSIPLPIIRHDNDTHINMIKDWGDFPYAIFTTEDFDQTEDHLLSDEKAIVVTSTGATRIIVPMEVIGATKKELYEYPYIITASKVLESKPLDIVYLSNGEPAAERNFVTLKQAICSRSNRLVRVDGVKGRANAYHAALEASETSWAFTVFAKLSVNPDFDWNWQPDRLQIPKHYIFYAKNPVNGLEYGHQAIIAYNKKLVLANPGRGLDFTLDDPHAVIEMLSGTANYNTDPFSTWRTAFREAIKLKADSSEISKRRLDAWMSEGIGEFAEYSIQGARDGVRYYEEVTGEQGKLKLSYEWAWLENKFNERNS